MGPKGFEVLGLGSFGFMALVHCELLGSVNSDYPCHALHPKPDFNSGSHLHSPK